MYSPVSLFIMDVSNSSTKGNGEELASYLDKLCSWITQWSDGIVPVLVKHRAGDEVIFAGKGYSTAYLIAFYIKAVWPFDGQDPYFGLSFGETGKPFEEIDIEKWIHPLVKQARHANNLLKDQTKTRPSFRFELDEFLSDNQADSLLYDEFRLEFEALLNGLLRFQHLRMHSQTDIQKRVFSLYLIYENQKQIADVLGKTPPTISSHYRKGHSEELYAAFADIVDVLDSLERKESKVLKPTPFERTLLLKKAIRSHLQRHLPIPKGGR
jgi:hypothetical protein